MLLMVVCGLLVLAGFAAIVRWGALEPEPPWSRIDPNESPSPGPGWLSVVVFAALVVAHGMSVAAVAGRYSRVLPLLSRRVRSVLAHAPLLLMAPMAPVLVPVTLVGALSVLAARLRPLASTVRSPRSTVVGRAVLVAILLVAIPGSVSTLADILDRGP